MLLTQPVYRPYDSPRCIELPSLYSAYEIPERMGVWELFRDTTQVYPYLLFSFHLLYDPSDVEETAK